MRLVSHSDDRFSLAVVPNSDNKCVYNSRRRLRPDVWCRCSLSCSAQIFYACLCVRLQNIKPMCNYANAQRQNRRRRRRRRRWLWYVRAKRMLFCAIFHFLHPWWGTASPYAAAVVAIVCALVVSTLALLTFLQVPLSMKPKSKHRKTKGNLIVYTSKAYGGVDEYDGDGVGSVIKMFANLLHNTSY